MNISSHFLLTDVSVAFAIIVTSVPWSSTSTCHTRDRCQNGWPFFADRHYIIFFFYISDTRLLGWSES